MAALAGGHGAALSAAAPGWAFAGALAAPQPQPGRYGRWQRAGSLCVERVNHTAVPLADGGVLVAGGTAADGSGAVLGAERLLPDGERWVVTSSPHVARVRPAAAGLPSGHVLVFGGSGGTPASTTAELYDPRANTWVVTGGLPAPFTRPAAALLPDGRVLAVDAASSPTAAVYDPRSRRWELAAPLGRRYQSLTLTACAAGQVLVLGASPHDPLTQAHVPQAELYDPTGGVWRAARPPAAARFGHSATPLPDGRVLVAGGTRYAGGSYLTTGTTELYDPLADEWLPAGTMHAPRTGHAACALGGGAVLVVGGSSDGTTGSSAATAELYNATTNSWQAADSMLVPRPSGHQLTPSGAGRALLTGCQRSVGSAATPAELFTAR